MNRRPIQNAPASLTRSTRVRRSALAVLAAVAASAVIQTPALAAVLTWDATSGTAGAQDGAGTWADASPNWRNTGTSTDDVSFANGDTVTFGAGSGAAGNVTINGTVTTNSVTFATPGSASYTLINGASTPNLNLSSGAVINVATGVTPTISATITGSNGLTKSGIGTLTLGGANTAFTGTTTISQGTVIANHASALGATANSLTLGNATTGANPVTLTVGSAVAATVTLNTVSTSNFGTTQTINLSTGSALAANANGLVATLNLAGSVPLTVLTTSAGHSTAQDWTGSITGTGIAGGSTALTLDGTATALRMTFGGTSGTTANTFTGDVIIKGPVSTQGTTFSGAVAARQNLGFLNNNVTVNAGGTGWTIVWGGETVQALNGSGNIVLFNQNALNNVGLTIGNNNGGGTYSGVISGGFGVEKVGNATQTLSGANSYTGITTITGGRLALGAADRISNSSTLVLSGGILDTAGFNETLSTLRLTTNSRIDLGSGASILTFAASNAQAWTAATTLTIDNWTGSLLGGGADRLLVGTTTAGLTTTQLSQITFTGFGEGAQILSNGEIVPVPEPAGLTLLGLAVAAGVTRRRRRSA